MRHCRSKAEQVVHPDIMMNEDLKAKRNLAGLNAASRLFIVMDKSMRMNPVAGKIP